jgi:amino acid transporter
MENHSHGMQTHLKRTLTVPLLVFYGVGVTVGAGIFALLGEIVAIAGMQAPLSFLVAGIAVAFTAASYALLAQAFPRAGGVAIYIHEALGALPARLAGYAIVATAIISSAVITSALAGYANQLVATSPAIVMMVAIGALAMLACWGIRESVGFAALITLIECGVLVVVMVFGLPEAATNFDAVTQVVNVNTGTAGGILMASIIAFYAFIGFEDIVNMAEETPNPTRALPRAIAWTLAVTVFLYVGVCMIAVLATGVDFLAGSSAPMSDLFLAVTGFDDRPVALVAVLAMVNGVLVQLIMASRLLYGMASDGIAPQWLCRLHPTRQTPVIATVLIAICIYFLAIAFPLGQLAKATSAVTLIVFAFVNISLVVLGNDQLNRFRWIAVTGAGLCISLLAVSLL